MVVCRWWGAGGLLQPHKCCRVEDERQQPECPCVARDGYHRYIEKGVFPGEPGPPLVFEVSHSCLCEDACSNKWWRIPLPLRCVVVELSSP